jgi:hypothetical protein
MKRPRRAARSRRGLAALALLSALLLGALPPGPDRVALSARLSARPARDPLHALALQCLAGSASPYGYADVRPRSAADRRAEKRRLLALTRPLAAYPPHVWLAYAGPWIEDVWISEFSEQPIENFGPWVPLFVPWVRMYRVHNISKSRVGYPEAIRPILKTLQSDFLYVTVNGNDYGLEGMRVPNPDIPPNLLIISASGRGHVPILLHFRQQQPVDALPRKGTLIFLGKLKRGGRTRVIKQYQRYFGNNITVAKKVPDWITAYREHALVMSVRGNARGCFRTAEILELGLVPVLAFENHKWVPYLNSTLPWNDIGFHTVVSEIPAFVETVNGLTEERLAFMRKTVRKYRDSHFTLNATVKQIALFLKYGYERSDLRCGTFYPTT